MRSVNELMMTGWLPEVGDGRACRQAYRSYVRSEIGRRELGGREAHESPLGCRDCRDCRALSGSVGPLSRGPCRAVGISVGLTYCRGLCACRGLSGVCRGLSGTAVVDCRDLLRVRPPSIHVGEGKASKLLKQSCNIYWCNAPLKTVRLTLLG